MATTGQVFLGLTVDCARCHDHKIDPIPQKDYYRLLAFFQNINPYRNGGPNDDDPSSTPEDRLAVETARKDVEAISVDKTQRAIAAIENEFRQAYETGTQSGDGRRRPRRPALPLLSRHLGQAARLRRVKPEEDGRLARRTVRPRPRSRDEAFGFVFEGTLIVPQDGTYTFYLDSDDGSRLTVAGKTVVEYDGIHGVGKEKTATVRLTARPACRSGSNTSRTATASAWASPGRGPGFGRPLALGRCQDDADGFALLFIAKEGPRCSGPSGWPSTRSSGRRSRP